MQHATRAFKERNTGEKLPQHSRGKKPEQFPFTLTAAVRYNEYILSEQLHIHAKGRATLCTIENSPTWAHKRHHYQPAVERWEVIQMSVWVRLGIRDAGSTLAKLRRCTRLFRAMNLLHASSWRLPGSDLCLSELQTAGHRAPGLSLPIAAADVNISACSSSSFSQAFSSNRQVQRTT